jgi:TatD DNase family protein
MDQLFINIHSHHPEESDTLAIQNVYIGMEGNLIPEKTQSEFKSIGIHPWFVTEESFVKQRTILNDQLASDDFFAIGECGLDRLRGPEIPFQLEVLKAQCQLAEELGKPVILHLVKAYSDILAFQNVYNFSCPMVIHGFRGNATEATQLVKNGFYLSFGTALLDNIPKLEASFRHMPPDRIFLETDTAEIPVKQVYEKAASLKEISLEKMILHLKNNLETIR